MVPAVAITAATSAAVEASAAMEAAAAKAFPVESATSQAVMVPAASAEAAPAPAIVTPVAVPTAGVKTAAVPAGMAIIPVIPRPNADEHAVDKPLRAIVAKGRASVRVIVIVSIGADGRWAKVSRTTVRCANAQAHNHSLGVRERSAKQANAE
jgi:hypothetical protein